MTSGSVFESADDHTKCIKESHFSRKYHWWMTFGWSFLVWIWMKLSCLYLYHHFTVLTYQTCGRNTRIYFNLVAPSKCHSCFHFLVSNRQRKRVEGLCLTCLSAWWPLSSAKPVLSTHFWNQRERDELYATAWRRFKQEFKICDEIAKSKGGIAGIFSMILIPVRMRPPELDDFSPLFATISFVSCTHVTRLGEDYAHFDASCAWQRTWRIHFGQYCRRERLLLSPAVMDATVM